MNNAKQKLYLAVIVLLLLVLGTGGAWFYQQTKINDLDIEVATLKQNLSDEKAKNQVTGVVNDALGSKARDTERTADINQLQGQIEAYYAVNGYYPTLANINDNSFRQKNMQGLDDEALSDPASDKKVIVSSPVKNAYAYNPSPDKCTDDCMSYKLTATYEDGTTYIKTNLN